LPFVGNPNSLNKVAGARVVKSLLLVASTPFKNPISDSSKEGNPTMKKLTTFLLAGVLLFGAAACSDAEKTSADAPDTTQASPQAPDADATKAAKEDAQSKVRRDQLNSDIRAREQRNNATGGDTQRAEDDLESEVASKLEANIPDGQLVVEAEDNGTVTVSGTVPKQDQIAKIEPLAKQIKGVKTVAVKATVAPPKAEDSNQKTQ
jgi:osmotically-inducible protein OsmY